MAASCSVVGDLDEPDPLPGAEDLASPGEGVLARPDLGPELEVVQAELLGELAPEGRFDDLTLVDPSAGRGPPDLAAIVAKLDEEEKAK